MKIVDWPTFAAMPEGTVYTFYEPRIFTCFGVKGETQVDQAGKPIDFFYTDLVPEFERGEETDPIVFGSECRWGMFDYGQRFCVYEAEDINKLIRLVGG